MTEINDDEWDVVEPETEKKWILRSELQDVLWFDKNNQEVLDFLKKSKQHFLSIGEALELGLDKSEYALWGENLRTHGNELDRTFLRLTLK